MSLREAISTIGQHAAVWGIRIASLLLIIFVIASQLIPHLGILGEKEAALLGIGLVFIFLLSEQFKLLFEKSRENEDALLEKQNTLSQQFEEQAVQLESLKDSSAIRLFSLTDCLDDLSTRLNYAEQIEIEHLGLDMALAWEPICTLLNGSVEFVWARRRKG